MKKYITFASSEAHGNLTDVLTSHKLASLGDAYVNFAYSLALSNRKREPTGVKVKGSMLAEALRRSGIRSSLPSKMTRHKLADAAEALIVYGWLHSSISLEESVAALEKHDDPVDGFSKLLTTIINRIKLP